MRMIGPVEMSTSGHKRDLRSLLTIMLMIFFDPPGVPPTQYYIVVKFIPERQCSKPRPRKLRNGT